MSLPRSTSVGPASSERLGQEDTTREAHNSDHSSAAALWRWRVLRLQKRLVGTGAGETQCWTGGQSVGDHLGGGADHRLCGLAARILWLKSSFALMAKARLKKTEEIIMAMTTRLITVEGRNIMFSLDWNHWRWHALDEPQEADFPLNAQCHLP